MDVSTENILWVAVVCLACLITIIIVLGVFLLLRGRRPKPPVYPPEYPLQPQWQPPQPGGQPPYGTPAGSYPPGPSSGYPGGQTVVYGDVPPANPSYGAPSGYAGQPGVPPSGYPGGQTVVYGDEPPVGPPQAYPPQSPQAPGGQPPASYTLVFGDQPAGQPPIPPQMPLANSTLSFDSPLLPAVRLTVVSGSANLAGLELPIQGITIGRSSECALILNDPLSSRQHATIAFAGTGWFVQDLNSQNGTYLNNVRISRETLHPGDQIRIGSTVLSFGN
jgi:ABC transport system ATP-binding/permease protein